MKSDVIYLDNNATTRPYPLVISEISKLLTTFYGNPSSSSCPLGRAAHERLEHYRNTIGHLLGIRDPSRQLIFTSCATESNNIVIRGRIAKFKDTVPHVVTTNIEHPSIKITLDDLERRECCTVTALEVTKPHGLIVVEDLVRAVKKGKTVLLTVILANNETGQIQRSKSILHAISKLDGSVRRLVHVHYDLTQMVGRYRLDFEKMGMDSASFSSHKFHGTKGVGGLYLKDPSSVDSVVTGGLQEHNLRAGTENIAGIGGMAVALRVSMSDIERKIEKTFEKRNFLQRALQKAFPGRVVVNGLPPEDRSDTAPEYYKRLYNTLSVSFNGVDNKALVAKLSKRGLCVNVGSACSKMKGSKTLKAIGLTEEQQRGTLRISLSHQTTQAEVEKAFRIICAAILGKNSRT